ncbi:MAG TPA: acyl carrier protein [Vicinamibacterales bacterium]|nr:acyl carrier protein [Vicinamibacterales bacterium]
MTASDRIQIETGVRQLIGQVSGHDVWHLAADADMVAALSVDSLQGLQILAAVEKRFDVRLPDEQLIELRTLRRIADAVERAGAGEVS